jgi:heterodisulfide reductase subunit D
MKAPQFSLRQMIEIDGCTRCGECTLGCPVYEVTKNQVVTPVETLRSSKDWALCQSWVRKLFFRSKAMTPERLNAFALEAYQCTLCGHCEVVCPVNIRNKEMKISLRKNIMRSDLEIPSPGPILENLETGRNIAYPTNDDRWLVNISPKPTGRKPQHPDIVYFVGCVSSFFPITYSIPQSTLFLLEKANEEVGLLGPEEWCCGWPLLGMGKEEMVYELMNHNIERINAMGAKTLLCGCPSCYAMWKHEYPRLSPKTSPQFEILHSTEYLVKVLKEERIPLFPLEASVTYHDPCDLGRGAGIYEPPREIIRMISGTNFVEMRNHGRHATCCGGGGDMEMFFPNITRDIANLKIREIEETKAEIVLSSCQQCKRTMSVGAKRLKKKLRFLDIAEFVLILSERQRTLAFENLLDKT